jgi:hypothetical protein
LFWHEELEIHFRDVVGRLKVSDPDANSSTFTETSLGVTAIMVIVLEIAL